MILNTYRCSRKLLDRWTFYWFFFRSKNMQKDWFKKCVFFTTLSWSVSDSIAKGCNTLWQIKGFGLLADGYWNLFMIEWLSARFQAKLICRWTTICSCEYGIVTRNFFFSHLSVPKNFSLFPMTNWTGFHQKPEENIPLTWSILHWSVLATDNQYMPRKQKIY